MLEVRGLHKSFGGLKAVDDALSPGGVTVGGGIGEDAVGGPVMNIVPKSGGNSFKGSAFLNGAGNWSSRVSRARAALALALASQYRPRVTSTRSMEAVSK